MTVAYFDPRKIKQWRNIPFSDFKDLSDAVNCSKNDHTPRTATIIKIFSLLNNSRLGIFNGFLRNSVYSKFL